MSTNDEHTKPDTMNTDEEEFLEAVGRAIAESQACQNLELAKTLDSMNMHSSVLGLSCEQQATQRLVFFEKKFWLCDHHFHCFGLARQEWLNCPWC